jgi:hypothetical protein
MPISNVVCAGLCFGRANPCSQQEPKIFAEGLYARRVCWRRRMPLFQLGLNYGNRCSLANELETLH